jgi:hypothetical protein
MDDTRPQDHATDTDRDEQPVTGTTPTDRPDLDRPDQDRPDRPTPEDRMDPRGLRMRTVVFGLVLAVVAVSVVVAEATDLHVDGVTVAIAALIGAGLLLFGGAMATLVRERRRD